MSETKQVLSMIELAEAFLKEQKSEASIKDIIQYVFTTKEENVEDVEKVTRFYMDMTTSGKFVFCGEDKWDLKENNLDLWDKDGHAFVTEAEIVEDSEEEDLDFTEFNIDDIDLPSDEVVVVEEDEVEEEQQDVDQEEKEALKEEEEYLDVEISMKSTDDDDVDVDFGDEDYDEDDYNDIMDDYEDMYED